MRASRGRFVEGDAAAPLDVVVVHPGHRPVRDDVPEQEPKHPVAHDATDLFGLTAALVAIPSESHQEAELAAVVEERLRARAPSLRLDRVGESVLARTELGRDQRVVRPTVRPVRGRSASGAGFRSPDCSQTSRSINSNVSVPTCPGRGTR